LCCGAPLGEVFGCCRGRCVVMELIALPLVSI
jgi:hypothetical protein